MTFILVPDNVWMWLARQCVLRIVPWELVNPCRNRGHFSDTCQDAGFTLGKEYSMWCWIWIGEIVFQGIRGPGHIPCRDLLLWEEINNEAGLAPMMELRVNPSMWWRHCRNRSSLLHRCRLVPNPCDWTEEAAQHFKMGYLVIYSVAVAAHPSLCHNGKAAQSNKWGLQYNKQKVKVLDMSLPF